MWGVGLGLRVQGKLGAAKGWVVLAGGWWRSGGLSGLAVAAVSRDTVRSFSPPAATPVTVSVTAMLLLAAGGSHGRGAQI